MWGMAIPTSKQLDQLMERYRDENDKAWEVDSDYIPFSFEVWLREQPERYCPISALMRDYFPIE